MRQLVATRAPGPTAAMSHRREAIASTRRRSAGVSCAEQGAAGAGVPRAAAAGGWSRSGRRPGRPGTGRRLSVLTGCDRALAEVARRALAGNERLALVEGWFEREAGARGYAPAVLEEVWEIIKGFGAQGFCRAHAVAFVVPSCSPPGSRPTSRPPCSRAC